MEIFIHFISISASFALFFPWKTQTSAQTRYMYKYVFYVVYNLLWTDTAYGKVYTRLSIF